MKFRSAIAMYAILGLVALGAVAATAQPALCCGGGVKQASAGGSGCCPHMTKTADAGGCPMGKGGGSCSYMAGGVCGSMSGERCGMPAEECEKMIRTYYKTHGWLGIEMACADPDNMEPTVTKVFPGSPAEAAGLKVGDVLVSVNGIAYGPESAEAMQKLVADGMKPGDALTYQIQRANESAGVQAKATLVKAPKGALAEMIADHKGTAHKADREETSKKS